MEHGKNIATQNILDKSKLNTDRGDTSDYDGTKKDINNQEVED